ncbi:MAG TPA: CxxxxCH/CxxCH domain-containing protein, partial [Polyangia bacterium]|nr:CxxxxCH/CxxCH domain-containing protein [Polyangia bacterium]
DGAQPSWSVTAGQCSNVYCHGGGKTLSGDAATTIIRQPTWVPGSGAAACGACHGIPPVDTAHAATLGLGDCVRCHPTTMNASGGLVSGGTHMNGVIDAQ